MEYLGDSSNYNYLMQICDNMEPRDEEELIFKARFKWLLDVALEQSRALLNIDNAQKSCVSSIPLRPKPTLKLIMGGK